MLYLVFQRMKVIIGVIF